MRTPFRLLLVLLAATAVRAGIRRARREMDPPIERTGAAMPLERERGHIGATSDAHLVSQAGEPDWVRELAGWLPPAPGTPAGRIAAYAWAAPATLGGLILGLLSGRTPEVRDGVLLFAGVRGLPALGLRRGGFAATTLGHVVIALRDPSPALMAHELAHTRQAERMGPFTGPVYWYLLARYGYARHPMERAARIAGRTVREAAPTAS
ncbi:hypothetical protein BH23ACT9_BH23ACT9_39810 [soil metagenome]